MLRNILCDGTVLFDCGANDQRLFFLMSGRLIGARYIRGICMAAQAEVTSSKKKNPRRKLIKGVLISLGITAISAGIIEREKIGHFFQFLESLFMKASFANSPLVQGFLHPQIVVCSAENTPIQFMSDNLLYEVDEAGDSVGEGFFWRKNGKEGSAPVSLFYGGAVDAFLKQDAYRQRGYHGCIVQNVAVKSTVLSDLPRQFLQLKFIHPATLLISDGGNLILQWCIENETFLRSLMVKFKNIADASDTEIQELQKDLEKLKAAIESVCLIIQGHYEIALGDLLGLKLDKAQLETVIILGIAPVWKAATIPLSADFRSQKTFPMQGNLAAEVFGRYLVTSGNNAIKAAINNADEFLKNYGILLRYQDIDDIVEVMGGIHPVPSEQRKIAIELLKHTFLGQTPLAEIAVPQFQDL